MSEGRRWCYVSSVSGDVTGWVAGDFLREGSAPGVATHLPTPVPQAPAGQPPRRSRRCLARPMTRPEA
jgi:hypothetical protein